MRKLLFLLCAVILFSCSKSDSSPGGGLGDEDSTTPYLSISIIELGTIKISGEFTGKDKEGVGIYWKEGDVVHGGNRTILHAAKTRVGETGFDDFFDFGLTREHPLKVKTYNAIQAGNISDFSKSDRRFAAEVTLVKITSIVGNRCSGTIKGNFIDVDPKIFYPFTGEFENIEYVETLN